MALDPSLAMSREAMEKKLRAFRKEVTTTARQLNYRIALTNAALDKLAAVAPTQQMFATLAQDQKQIFNNMEYLDAVSRHAHEIYMGHFGEFTRHVAANKRRIDHMENGNWMWWEKATSPAKVTFLQKEVKRMKAADEQKSIEIANLKQKIDGFETRLNKMNEVPPPTPHASPVLKPWFYPVAEPPPLPPPPVVEAIPIDPNFKTFPSMLCTDEQFDAGWAQD